MVEATCPVAECEPRIGALRRLDLIINLKTAKALGIDVPPTLLAHASKR